LTKSETIFEGNFLNNEMINGKATTMKMEDGSSVLFEGNSLNREKGNG